MASFCHLSIVKNVLREKQHIVKSNLVQPMCNDYPLDLELEVGVERCHCSEVIYVIKVRIGTSKLWSLWTDGRYSEVVVSLVV